MSAMSELVLVYDSDPLHSARSQEVFTALGIPARTVSLREVTQTVGHLAGLPGHEARPVPMAPPQLSEPMLVLAGFSSERMDVLFAALRENGAPPPNRKAILTPTNAGWTLDALYVELGREHEAMHGKKGR